MIVDGKKIADELYADLKKDIARQGAVPVLVVILVGDDPASKKFVEAKQKAAEKIGVEFRSYEYETTITTEDLVFEIKRLNTDDGISGIVVQLPLPETIDTDTVLAALDSSKDVDALSPESRVLAPVAGAVQEVLKRNAVSVRGKKAVVLGQGRLVGKPVAVWLTQEGADVQVADITTKDITRLTKDADIVVSGAGVPGLIKPDMLKDGVVLVDAGTSEQSGKLVGDADPACANKCSLFTPVPGGVGPVTVAMVFKNLLALRAKELSD